jgi:hypothetical protein
MLGSWSYLNFGRSGHGQTIYSVRFFHGRITACGTVGTEVKFLEIEWSLVVVSVSLQMMQETWRGCVTACANSHLSPFHSLSFSVRCNQIDCFPEEEN